MKRCPITYQPCKENEKYTKKGLHFFSKTLMSLNDFPYTLQEQIKLATQYATKLSIQGVQPKLSLNLNNKEEQFTIVEKGGHYILKPPHQIYPEVPENEDLTMRLAAVVGIDIPLHGLIYNIDGTLSYIIKRFDRLRYGKVATEDFSQLLEYSRDTKYDSSMEKIIPAIEKNCTFPLVEKTKLFRLTLFNFLVGNEDMHLKNFSLIRHPDLVELSPAYDLLNTSILFQAKEEIALPIRGKKSNLQRADLVDYYGGERLGLSEVLLKKELLNFEKSLSTWNELIDISFLSNEMKKRYKALIRERWGRLSR